MRALAAIALAGIACSTHREEARRADVRATAAVKAEADTRTVAERGPRTVVVEEWVEPESGPAFTPSLHPPSPDPSLGTPEHATGVSRVVSPTPAGAILHRRTTITEAPLAAGPAERVTTEAHADLAADAGTVEHVEQREVKDSKPSIGLSLWMVGAGVVALVLAGAAVRWAIRRFPWTRP